MSPPVSNKPSNQQLNGELSPRPGRFYTAPAQRDLNVGGNVLRMLLYAHSRMPRASPAAFPTKPARVGLLSFFCLQPWTLTFSSHSAEDLEQT